MVLLLITISFFVIFYFKNKMLIGNIKEKGYILHKEFLESQYCDRIMMSVNTEMLNKNKEEFFTNGSKRRNIALPLDENIKPILIMICKKSSIISNIKNPVMIECGILLAYPNSKDTKWESKKSKTKTFMINLDATKDENNMTQLYAGSHLNKETKELIEFKCNRGDMYAYDNRVVKRQTGNYSETIKPVFYFSIIDDKDLSENDILSKDSNNTLKSEYRGKVDLKKIL